MLGPRSDKEASNIEWKDVVQDIQDAWQFATSILAVQFNRLKALIFKSTRDIHVKLIDGAKPSLRIHSWAAKLIVNPAEEPQLMRRS